MPVTPVLAPREARKEPEAPPSGEGAALRRRILLILLEAGLVGALLSAWVFWDGMRESRNLVVLFLYSFPSEFLVGLVPHEPVLIFFGEVHHPLVVALVAVVSTVMAEGLNYSFFSLFYGIPAFNAVFQKKAVKRIAEMFSRRPFAAITFAAFTPVPFFPVRFLVVVTGYPVWKYLLGVFVARGPRFYLLAWLGASFAVPPLLLLALFLGIFLLVNVPALYKVILRST